MKEGGTILKVLHVIDSLASGGAEKLIDELIPVMSSKCGIEIDVLLLSDVGNVFGENLKKNNIKVDDIP